MKPSYQKSKTRLNVESALFCVMIGLFLCGVVMLPDCARAGLKEDLAAVADKHEGGSDVSKSMDVNNPALELSTDAKTHNGKGYIKIAGGLSRWNAEDLFHDLMLLADQSVEEIHIYLNSPGGNAAQGLCLTDELRVFREGHPDIPVIVHGRGLIASAAIPVFLQGTKRICSESTIFLIHPAALVKWGFFTETLKDLESQTKMIKILRGHYATAVSSRTNLDKDRVIEMMGEDTWFTTEEAVEWGFVDEVE